MKVIVSKNEYNYIELIGRKHKKLIAVSTLAEALVSLETYNLISDLVDYDPSSSEGSALIVGWSKEGADLIDLRNNLDKEKVDTLVDGHRITTHKVDKMNFSLDLVVYHVPSAKEKNNTSSIKSK
jgi:hypothetical protein